MSLGSYRIGADLLIELDINSGTITGDVTAAMVRVSSESAAAIMGPRIPLEVQSRLNGNALVGFSLSLPGAQTAALVPSLYAVDLKSVDSFGAISITDQPAFITMLPAAV